MFLSLVKKIVKSIALVPTVLALSFLALAIVLTQLHIDYGKISSIAFMVIDDKQSVQTIFAFIIGGIFTLTVFSYTMVMNVLNRNINNYSPRLIPLLLSEKHHQIILGFTSGTIIFCLALSIELNNITNEYFPEIAASLGVIFTIACVLLFIYFIHSVSQSIHINHILRTVYERTKNSLLERSRNTADFKATTDTKGFGSAQTTGNIGYFHTYDISRLNSFAINEGLKLRMERIPGSFIHTHENLITSSNELTDKQKSKLHRLLAVDLEVPLDVPEIGFKHLVEVAVKASSPAINDPGTAKSCIDYLTELFIVRIQQCNISAWMEDPKGQLIIHHQENGTLLELCYREMWCYMKDDYLLPKILKQSLQTIAARTDFDIQGILPQTSLV